MKNKDNKKISLRQKIWHFTDVSTSRSSSIYHIFIGLVIAVSAMLAFWLITIPQVLADYVPLIEKFEAFVLILFTFELIIRFICSPHWGKFFTDKYNIIDFLAVAPFYLSIESAVILRVLRILRLAKLWKTFASAHLFEMIHLRGGIIEKVTPFVLLLLFLKYIVVTLEKGGWWIPPTNLDLLFTIIGFALGIILSQKIGITYGKFRELEDALAAMHAKLSSVISFMDKMKKDTGTKAGTIWLENFLNIYNGPAEGSVRRTIDNNNELYESLAKVGNTELIPHHRMAAIADMLFNQSIFILSWKSNFTPRAFDRLLLQIIMMYLLMVIAFIPGFKGVISILLASYLLYGMYYVTKEMDLATGEEQEALIRLEPMRLRNYLKILKKHPANKKPKAVAKKPTKATVKKSVKKATK